MDNEIMNSPVTEENLEAVENQASARGENAQKVADNVQKSEENSQTDTENVQKSEKVTADDVARKLDDELKKYTGQGKGKLVDLMVKYLKKRAVEDTGMVSDIMQEVKTLSCCIQYVYEQAKKQATGGCAVISDDVVFEWGEDYYHKAEKELQKTKQPAGKDKVKKTTKLNDGANKKAAEMKKAPSKAEKRPEAKQDKKPAEPKKEKKPKKESGVMDGQMDLFSMMGL